MTENPDLKFSVEGHTDSTGNAANNQTLSEARSKAIVDKLVEMGIAADRLASAGKGQANPIADNATDEGRAKNRRVRVRENIILYDYIYCIEKELFDVLVYTL